jgi:hypothetical protein
MKENESKIAFICFFYFHLFFVIGTFQRVMAEKNKKISPPPNSPLRLCAKRLARSALSFIRSPVAAGALPRAKGFDQPKVYGGFWF